MRVKKGGEHLLNAKDNRIIEQITARDERALEALTAAYGKICRKTAQNILGNTADADEAFNDALFRAWNAIPMNPPAHLQAYLITLTRRIALDKRRAETREKRGGGEVPLALSELEGCIDSGESVEAVLNRNALRTALNDFLETLSDEKRRIFIERYTFLMSAGEIAKRHAMTSASVKMVLSRMRKALRQYLEEEELL